MGQATTIEWCDSTLNLQMGCDGCELWNRKAGVLRCYAGQLHERWGNKAGWPDSFDKPKLFTGRLEPALRWPDLTGKERPEKPWLNGMPRLIFLDDLGDTFTESLPLDWLAPLLPRMADTPHQWLLLTKRANRMEEFSKLHPFPKNFWLMTSITCNANRNRIEHLLRCRGGSVRGISYEPALELVDFSQYLYRQEEHGVDWSRPVGQKVGACIGWTPPLDWIVCGGESGPGARPFDISWARDTVKQCKSAGVACFYKQGGASNACPHDRKGGHFECFPSDLQIREFPDAV
jgi:protein gp37